MKRCIECDKRFNALEHSKAKFCSPACQRQHYGANKYIIKNCAFCKNDFLVKSIISKTKTCSKQCTYNLRMISLKKTLEKKGLRRISRIRNCEICGNQLDEKRHLKAKTCSPKCAAVLRHRKMKEKKAVENGLAC